MELHLISLTPIHIGNGEELHSMDYVVHQNRWYRIDQARFFQFLTTLGAEAITAFGKWTVANADRIDAVEREKKRSQDKRDFNQQLSALRAKFSYLHFAREIGQEAAFTDFIRREVASLPIADPPQMKQQVRELLKRGDGTAYLPASSVKGAIRTALLYDLLAEKLISPTVVDDILERAIRQVDEKKREAEARKKRFRLDAYSKSFAEDLEHEAFYCAFLNERGATRTGEERYDLCKLLLVADEFSSEHGRAVENIDVYLVKKQKDRRSGKMEVQALQQRQTPSVEAIAEGQSMRVHLDFNIDFLLEVKKLIRDDRIPDQREAHWIGIGEKVRRLFRLDLSTLTPENKEEKRQEVLDHILNCLRRFSSRQLAEDQHWLARFTDADRRRNYERAITQGFEVVFRREGRTLLHLGYGAGFSATTELLYFVDHLKDRYKAVMELFGLGDAPGADRRRKPGETYKANPDQFPKSKRLITRPNLIMPMGWLEITNGPAEAQEEAPARQEKAEAAGPTFPRGRLKAGAEIDAEIIAVGIPNRVKLFLAEDNLPEMELRYGQGFPPEQLGKLIVVAIGTIKKDGTILNVQFKRFK